MGTAIAAPLATRCAGVCTTMSSTSPPELKATAGEDGINIAVAVAPAIVTAATAALILLRIIHFPFVSIVVAAWRRQRRPPRAVVRPGCATRSRNRRAERV